jgi:hypothetical protein
LSWNEGRREEAVQQLDAEVRKYAAASFVAAPMATGFYSVMGDKTQALDWLERCINLGDDRIDWFQRNPLLRLFGKSHASGSFLNPLPIDERNTWRGGESFIP